MQRQVLLDTETTGLSPQQKHRIIEIGCVELINRRFTGRQFHAYLQPDREVDAGAIHVHGITNAFLVDMPRFKDIANEFKSFIEGAELIIHNAPFDVGFIEYEFKLMKDTHWCVLSDKCSILDTLVLARQKHPGQRNNLDALCKRYHIEFSHRTKHGALLDAEILGQVYLAMTAGQNALVLDATEECQNAVAEFVSSHPLAEYVLRATDAELKAHEAFLKNTKNGAPWIWEES